MTDLSRLRWLCRRGMKELDLMMNAYLDNHYTSASTAEQAHFRTLLEMPDPDLYALLLGRGTAADLELQHFTRSIRYRAEQD